MSPEVLSTPASLEQFSRLSRSGSLYAVLDACKQPEVLQKCNRLGPRSVSLYRGSAEKDYAHIAPYLVVLDSELIEWIAERIWDRPWGIFVYCDSGHEALRTHLRHFLTVRLPDRSEVFFRFYDPRVLRTFLDSSTPSELETFFGPVRAYAVGETGGDNVTLFRPRRRG